MREVLETGELAAGEPATPAGELAAPTAPRELAAAGGELKRSKLPALVLVALSMLVVALSTLVVVELLL